jgi:hypothetical protein
MLRIRGGMHSKNSIQKNNIRYQYIKTENNAKSKTQVFENQNGKTQDTL